MQISDPSHQAVNAAHVRHGFEDGFQEAFDTQMSGVSSDEDILEMLTFIRSFGTISIREELKRPPPKSKQGLTVLWYMFIEVAKVLDKELIQQNLISLLLWTKDYDALYRNLHSVGVTAPAWEAHHFAEGLQKSWEKLLVMPYTVSQQCNLAIFSATALGVGICDGSLGMTALWYLRKVLETDDEAALTLLPAAVVWIETARLKLLTFSAANKSYEKHPKAHSLTPGSLAVKIGIDQYGFSLQRWLFWRKRFQELSLSADPARAEKGKKGFMAMITCGRELDYNVPGEDKFKKAMEKELRESGKESVDGEDIDLNVDWEN